ncbi:MAG: anti-sigma factor [Salinibacter sp.]
MQIPERPFDGDAPDDGAPSYEWLDEWLCEYVDGTMDPSLEAVFEQYVEANPELKAHVERLRQTRELLGGCEAPETPASDPQPDVSREVEEDLLQSSPALPEQPSARPGAMVGIVSSIAVALVVGFLAGSMLGGPAAPAVSRVDGPSSAQERRVRGEAPPRSERTPLPRSSRASSFSTEEAHPSRPAPSSGADTVGSRSALTTIGDR